MFTVALGLVVLLIAIMLDSDHFKFIIKPEYQVIIGTIVVAVILFDNAFAGLLFGLAMITMYTRVIARKYGINLDVMSAFDKNNKKYSYTQNTVLKQGSPMRNLVKDKKYVTPSNLLDAQNNIVDTKNYTNSYIGIPEMYGQPVYSAEGIDKDSTTEVEGYDSSVYIGSSVKR
jgi:hypothetical protein